MTALRLLVACATIVAAAVLPLAAQPDVRQMSGTPLPVGDMPAGTVTVRLLRGAISNPITDHPVRLDGAGTPLTATTNAAGRAEFTGLRVGARLKAVATVGSERLESQEFTVPASGGIRLMLVAGDPGTSAGAPGEPRGAPSSAQPGTIVLGSESRIVIEMGEDGLSVFNIFQVLNTAAAPVQTPEPLVFELPDEAKGATMLDGSSSQAVAAGKRVTVTGPFAPGQTLVQFVYTMPYAGPELTVQQKLPATLSRLAVAAQKVGSMNLTSPQVAQSRTAASGGLSYIVGEGPAIAAGETLTLNFTGLPRVPVWPRDLALALAAIILLAGAWASVRGTGVPGETARRRTLESQRDRLFGELTQLEQQRRANPVDDERYASRRRELVAALERVYAELDEEGVAVGRAS